MRAMTTLLAAILISLPALAQPGDPNPLAVSADQQARAKELVRKLDDDDVDVRDKASADLKAMGRLALTALAETMKGKPSNEVSVRVEKLLPLARKDDFDARAKVFLADADRKYGHALPGWTELKKAAGDTPDARKLFTAILKDDDARGMLTAAFAANHDERKAFEKRWTTRWMGGKNRSAGDPDWPVEWNMAALLADLVYDRDYSDGLRAKAVRGCLQRTDEGKLAVQEKGKYGQAVRALLRHWMVEQGGPYGNYDAAQLVPVAKFEDELRLGCLEKLLFSDFTGLRGYAMDELARTKDVKHVATLKKLFDSTEDRYKGRITENDGSPWLVEWRDSALALAVVLTGQKTTTYGFSSLLRTKDPCWSDQYQFQSDKGGMSADEKREAAFKKWAEWEKANPLPAAKDKK